VIILKREDIKLLLELAIGILLIIIAIKFFIAILPVIIIALIALLVYDSYKKQKGQSLTKKKDNGVKEAEIIKEKNID
jgi:uncharacterized membrane protein